MFVNMTCVLWSVGRGWEFDDKTKNYIREEETSEKSFSIRCFFFSFMNMIFVPPSHSSFYVILPPDAGCVVCDGDLGVCRQER